MLCQLCDRQMGPHRDSQERKKGAKASPVQWPLRSLCSCLSARTLKHKHPFHIASSCLSLLALGRRGAKNNRQALGLVGH